MPIFRYQYAIFGLLIISLTGCSSVEPPVSRTWEEFIPREEDLVVEEIPFGELPLKMRLSNGQVFPDSCDWQAYDRTVDGDTLLLESGVRVRFQGIDTPESKHPEKAVEPFAIKASEFTKDLLSNSDKVCLIDSSIGDNYDKYGRRLSYIFSEFGVDVNAEILSAGLAEGYFKYPFDRIQEFKALELRAKQERRNIWGD